MKKSMRTEKHIFNHVMASSLLLAVLSTANFAVAQPLTCSSVFSSQAAQEVLNSDVQTKIDQTIQDLSTLKLDLDQALAQGENDIAIKALTFDYNKKEQALIEYLEKHNIMTREHLTERIKQEIQKLQAKDQDERRLNERSKDEEARRRHEQEVQIKSSIIDGKRAILHKVEPGTFKMGKRVDVTITRPFDMMATPTTQIVWRTVADLAAQKLAGKYQINADPSCFKGDTHPVERVSYEDIQTWTKALNELSGAGEPALADLIPGHRQGDVYRLPTEAEWEFVIRGRGQYNDTYHFGNRASQLGDYGWYNRNSKHQTRAVAQKKPLMIDGKEFYDMHGNVQEWVHDWHQSRLPGGTDPQGPTSGTFRIIRGGNWSNDASKLRSGYRLYWNPQARSFVVGFRLVRSAP